MTSSPFGFAYIFHRPLSVFRDLVKPVVLQSNIREEREEVQIAVYPNRERRIAEHATVVFELWTGEVFKSRSTQSRDLEIILASDDTLRGIDLQWCFGALRYEVERLWEWKLDEAHSIQRQCQQLGYKLPDVPNSMVRGATLEPTLLKVLLMEVTTYIATSNVILKNLRSNPCEAIRDLGAMVRSARDNQQVNAVAPNCKEPM